MTDRSLNIAVGIATLGRRQVLATTIDLLARQTRLPNRLVICSVSSDDIDSDSIKQFPAPTTVMNGTIGSSAQRNIILKAATQADVVVFFDDDFFAEPSYLANLESLFLAHPDVVAATGFLFADGAQGPGLSIEHGLEIIQSEAASRSAAEIADCYGTYGCNMAFRTEPIRLNKILFDENLPLYGWQEDIDFSLSLAPYGRIVKAGNLRGVHLGIKLGRTSGIRFGYSQIANPVYLLRKGTMSWNHAMTLMWRNIAANLIRSLRPEPWIDRKGRLKGNLLALMDIANGRMAPSRILQLD
jgi:glycosyltransferase involved in cell wall biosynthesis